MSSSGAVLDRPAATQYERTVERSDTTPSKPWGEGEAPRVPVTYRVSAQTKIWIDLLAAALDIEKTTVIEGAVEELFAQRRDLVAAYLQRLHTAVVGEGKESLAELLAARRGATNR